MKVIMSKFLLFLALLLMPQWCYAVSYTIENGNKLTVDTNGNLGVGSTAPGQKLDVQGTARATYFVGDGTGITGISGSISGLTTNKLTKATSSTTIGDSQILDNGINVGIGSATPGKTLDVQGSVRAIDFFGNGSNLSGITSSQWTTLGNDVYNSNSGNVGIGTVSPTSGKFTIRDAADARNINFVTPTNIYDDGVVQIDYGGNIATEGKITTGGNVGIGSAAPGAALDVNGFIRSTSLTGSKCVHTDATGKFISTAADCGSGGTAAGNANAVQYTTGSGVFAGDETKFMFNGTNVGIGTVTTRSLLTVGPTGAAPTTASGIFVAAAGNQNIEVMNTSVTNSIDMGVNAASGFIESNGQKLILGYNGNSDLIISTGRNIGIGSLAPGMKLDVSGSARMTGLVLQTGNQGSGKVLTSDGTGSGDWQTPAAGSASAAGGTNAVQYNSGSSTFAGNEAAFSFNGTNVGIGTNITSAALSIFPNTVAAGGINFGDSLANIYRSVAGTLQFDGGIGVGGNAATISRFGAVVGATVASGHALLLASGANDGVAVGINSQYGWSNSTAPSGTVDTNISRLSAGSLAVGNGTAGNQSGTLVAANVGIGTFNVANGGLIVKTGNVGIGTVLPSSLLEVGNQKFNVLAGGNVGIGVISPANIFDVASKFEVQSGGNVGVGILAPNSLFDVNGKLNVLSGGNVGIGSNAPTSLLDVNGKFNVTSLGNVGVGVTSPVSLLDVSSKFNVLSGGNVGIGSTTPTSALDVNGTVKATNLIETIGFTMDGGGSAITTGKVKGFRTFPINGTIVGWSIIVDTGTCTVQTWKIAAGTAHPTAANSISTSGVAISSGTAVRSSTVSDFTSTAVTAGDIFGFNISAVSSATEISFNLEIKRS